MFCDVVKKWTRFKIYTYVLLNVFEYKIDGNDNRALQTQIAAMAPTITHRDGFGFNGNIMARYLEKDTFCIFIQLFRI